MNVSSFKNVSFDFRAIAVISEIAYFVITQNTRLSLRSKVFLFSYINLHKRPLFGNRKYN